MKVRYIKDPRIRGNASQFNVCAASEVIVYFDGGDATSEFVSELEVQIGTGWKPLQQAFADGDVITDNDNTCFFPPETQDERARGYRLA